MDGQYHTSSFATGEVRACAERLGGGSPGGVDGPFPHFRPYSVRAIPSSLDGVVTQSLVHVIRTPKSGDEAI